MVEKVCSDVLILHQGRWSRRTRSAGSASSHERASLEEVFATLAVDADVDRVGRELAEVGRL